MSSYSLVKIVSLKLMHQILYMKLMSKARFCSLARFIWYRKKVEQIHDKGSMDTNDDDQKSNDRKRPFDNSINEESDIQNDEEWESVSSDKVTMITMFRESLLSFQNLV